MGLPRWVLEQISLMASLSTVPHDWKLVASSRKLPSALFGRSSKTELHCIDLGYCSKYEDSDITALTTPAGTHYIPSGSVRKSCMEVHLRYNMPFDSVLSVTDCSF